MKETFYFPHDNNAHNDPKLMSVLMWIWLSWIWIYWIIIEIMHQQKDWKISEDEFKNYLKFYSWNEKEDFVEQVLNKFETSQIFCFEDWKVFSKRVLENKKFRSDLKEKRSKAWKKSAEKRALTKDNPTSVEQNSTSDEQWKGKRKEKENEKKENNKQELENLVLKWNNIKLPVDKQLPSTRKITEDLKISFRKIKQEFNLDEIGEWVNKYCNEILERNPTNSFADHRFTLYEFLKQKNWLQKYFNN